MLIAQVCKVGNQDSKGKREIKEGKRREGKEEKRENQLL